MRHLKMSYNDVLSMPVYERRFFLNSFIEENEKKKAKIEEEQENQNNTSNGKGTRTTKVSGEQLKSRLKSGEIPGI